MDDFALIEIVEAVRDRLRGDLPDLDRVLASIVQVDYRVAKPALLQECLVQVVYSGQAGRADNFRSIQRLIATAESFAPVPLQPATRPSSWVMQESDAVPFLSPEDEDKIFRGIRYLSLAAVHDGVSGELETGPRQIPSRFGMELSQCVSLRSALALTRKRIPGLKGNAIYRFLAAIGYPVPIPTTDAQRFLKYFCFDGNGSMEDYFAVMDRAARITGVPVTHLGHLFSLYSGGIRREGFSPVCAGRRPRCGECKLVTRCSNFHVGVSAESEPVRGRPIHEWSVDERPRERMLAGERLSNSELLAIILRTGSGRLSAVELGRELIHEFGTLHDLERASPQDIVQRMRGKGIGPAKAVEICAALELGRRVTQPAADTRLGLKSVGSSRDVFEMCRARYKAATQEEFLLLILNTKNRVQKEVSVSLGTLNSSIVHPRDVFRHALREAAAAVIFVHNHPSGDPSPSDEDILLTARLVDVGKLLGIQVLDHVIIGSHEWYSFSDHGRMK